MIFILCKYYLPSDKIEEITYTLEWIQIVNLGTLKIPEAQPWFKLDAERLYDNEFAFYTRHSIY